MMSGTTTGMTSGVQYLRSLIFVIQMYLMMLLMGLAFLPWTLFDRRGAYVGARTYCRYVRLTLRLICGTRTEVRGKIPEGEVLIASKHQSFLDIILIVSVVKRPKFIMKDSLRFAPILGFYALRLGCVPVKRGRRSEAIRDMMAGVTSGKAPPGQLIIYPQGTRVAPGAMADYKVGVAAIYEQTGQHVIPAATNVGLFWPRSGVLRQPGLAVVEFLPALAPGLKREDFRSQLRQIIETRSDALLEEGRASL
ncbi:lysophospholipid acyltransferase family protein [Oceanicola sp. S124]|uniref:lysophospholipid acyltransferase family protein n=1 Tax=Oceanicola sp. S124 TaxID=1042378 RepID=UPI0002558901|nr:lysophospholipid acyltransferase family protein [Oceanicola sp. S124]